MRLRKTAYGADIVGGMREEEEERKKEGNKIEKVVEGVFIFARASPISDLRKHRRETVTSRPPSCECYLRVGGGNYLVRLPFAFN